MFNLLIIILCFDLTFGQSFTTDFPTDFSTNFPSRRPSSRPPRRTTTPSPTTPFEPPLKFRPDCRDFETCQDVWQRLRSNVSCDSSPLSGLYAVRICGRSLKVYCDFDVDGFHAATVIQRRGDYGQNPLLFNQSWVRYQYGFGDKQQEFWQGLEFVHAFTQRYKTILVMDLEGFRSRTSYPPVAVFVENFKVDDADNNYKMTYSNRRSTYSNSIAYDFPPTNTIFTTYDNLGTRTYNCPQVYKGGWWYYSSGSSCVYQSNLNGQYYPTGSNGNQFRHGLHWQYITSYYNSLKYADMKLVIDNGRSCQFHLNGRCGVSVEKCNDLRNVAVAGHCGLEKDADGCPCKTTCCVPYECHNWDTIDSHVSVINNGLHLNGYFFDDEHGAFISHGINLGRYTPDDIINMGIHENTDLFSQIRPFLGLRTKKDVQDKGLNPDDISLSVSEAMQFYYIIKRKEVSKFVAAYGSKLSRRGEAVLASLFLWLGDFVNGEDCLKSKCTLNYLRDAVQTKKVTDDELKDALMKFMLCLICECEERADIQRLAKEIKYLWGGSYDHLPLNNKNDWRDLKSAEVNGDKYNTVFPFPG